MHQTLEDAFPRVITRNAVYIIHKKQEYIVAWVECFRDIDIEKNRRGTPILVVMTPDGTIVPRKYSATITEVKKLAMGLRRVQIRSDLGLTFDDEIFDIPTVRKLVARMTTKEWMGQYHDGNSMHFVELADLLGVVLEETYDIVRELETEGRIKIHPNKQVFVAVESQDEIASL